MEQIQILIKFYYTLLHIEFYWKLCRNIEVPDIQNNIDLFQRLGYMHLHVSWISPEILTMTSSNSLSNPQEKYFVITTLLQQNVGNWSEERAADITGGGHGGQQGGETNRCRGLCGGVHPVVNNVKRWLPLLVRSLVV